MYTLEGVRRCGLGEGGAKANRFTQGRSRSCKRVGSLVDLQSEAPNRPHGSHVPTATLYLLLPFALALLSLSACLPQTTCLPAEASPSLLRGRGWPFSGKNFPGDLKKKKRGRMRGAWKVWCDVFYCWRGGRQERRWRRVGKEKVHYVMKSVLLASVHRALCLGSLPSFLGRARFPNTDVDMIRHLY